MKASALLFRLRYPLHLFIFVLGFWAPWNAVLHLDPRGPNAHVWGILAANLSQLGLNLFSAFNLLLAIAIVVAVAGAFLRTWGGAYLGANIVKSSAMHAALNDAANEGILTDGPFGYLRNPLYVGTFLHTLALSLLMPRSGAIFTIAAIGLLQLFLIHGEEAFLTQKLGTPYTVYCNLVPRLFPTFRRRAVPAGLAPRWPQAFLGETYFWGVAGSYAVIGWRYNAALLTQCVIVSVGASIVARALIPRDPQTHNA
jgi:protein-S-isoprenylcysteine O-methyltransferase Ste14